MLSLNFTPFPSLIAEHIALRPLTVADADDVYIHRSDERILKFIDSPRAKSIDDAIAFILKINKAVADNESIFWAIQARNNPGMIGSICLWNIKLEEEEAEVGYVLHPDHQGKGLMQEALHTVLDYGFDEMQLRCILAEVHPDNIRSIALLVRNGFRQQSVAPDTAIYALERQFRISTVASKKCCFSPDRFPLR